MLSIIIVNYKNPPLLRLALTSLSRTLDANLDYEIIVIDSESSVETRQVVTEDFSKTFKNMRLVPFNKNIGYTRGVNEGIKMSQGEYILNINPDIILTKGAVEQMMDYLKKNPQVGLIGPKLLNVDGSYQQSAFGFYNGISITYRRLRFLPFKNYILRHVEMTGVDLSKTRPVDWVSGAALMTRKDTIAKVGLMDEKLFLYFSDVDWARRFWENGFQVIYYPDAAIYHYHRRESKRHNWIYDAFFNRLARQHILDGFSYLFKWGFFKVPHFTQND